MATTKPITPANEDWFLAALGEGNVTFTPRQHVFEWATTMDANPPAANGEPLPNGHRIAVNENYSASLQTGERFWLKGRGLVNITADNEAP